MHERRDEVTSVRLSKRELEKIDAEAEAAGFKHRGSYIRMKLGLEGNEDSLAARVTELETNNALLAQQLQELRKV